MFPAHTVSSLLAWGWGGGCLGELVHQREGVLGPFPPPCLARAGHRSPGAGPLLSPFERALPGPISPSVATKGKKINLQHGIFQLFYLFVLGVEVRMTSPAQMHIQSRHRNMTAIATTSPCLVRSNGPDATEENAAFEKLQENTRSHKQNNPLWRDPGKEASANSAGMCQAAPFMAD